MIFTIIFAFCAFEFVAAAPLCPRAATSCINVYSKMYDCQHLTEKCLIVTKLNVSLILPASIVRLTVPKDSFLRLHVETDLQRNDICQTSMNPQNLEFYSPSGVPSHCSHQRK